MHILKAVRNRNGVKTSHVFECTHYTVDELPEFFRIEFPLQAEDGTFPIKELKLPDDYDAIYHMSSSSGDTLDSWTWDSKENRTKKVSYRDD